MQRIYSVSLTKDFFSETVILPQYDEKYQLVFKFVNNEYKSSFNGKSAYFEGTRSDGLSFRYLTVVSGNTATFVIDRALTAINGEHKGQIVLYDGTGLRFGSSNVKILVEKAARPDNAIDADVTSQQTLLEQLQEIVDTAAETTTAAAQQIVGDLTSRVKALEDDTTTTLLGDTPITLTEDTDVRLMAAEQTEYTLSGIFLADYNSNDEEAEVRLNNTTLTKQDGKMIFEAVGEDINTCFADLRLNNLTVGDTYTLTITRGEYVRETTGGYFVIYDRNGDELARPGDISQDVVTVSFVATTPFARVRLQPTTNYYYETYGITTATIVNAVVTSQRSASFNGTLNLGVLSAGITISSTPTCQAYSVTRDTGIEVDDTLSATSKNPVQNRRITGAIGQLSDLTTTAKNSLVSAINEVVSGARSRHADKRCVVLGDSVPAFRTPPEDIPSIIAQQTDMTVYNCAFGGCRISDYVVPEGDTDPWEAFCLVRLADAITSGDWAYQDARIQSLVELETGNYSPIDHYTALKAMNWSNVDFLIIHFAGNDPGNVRFDDPNDDDNTYYYLGAFRYSIRKLLTAYPHLKLLVIGANYHKTGGSNTDDREYTIDGQTYHYYDWSDRLMAECKNFHIPTLDWYRSNGLNALTVDHYMTSDGKHPNYIGNQLLAGQIVTRLLSQY